jgi:hypothetical protein
MSIPWFLEDQWLRGTFFWIVEAQKRSNSGTEEDENPAPTSTKAVSGT